MNSSFLWIIAYKIIMVLDKRYPTKYLWEFLSILLFFTKTTVKIEKIKIEIIPIVSKAKFITILFKLKLMENNRVWTYLQVD